MLTAAFTSFPLKDLAITLGRSGFSLEDAGFEVPTRRGDVPRHSLEVADTSHFRLVHQVLRCTLRCT